MCGFPILPARNQFATRSPMKFGFASRDFQKAISRAQRRSVLHYSKRHRSQDHSFYFLHGEEGGRVVNSNNLGSRLTEPSVAKIHNDLARGHPFDRFPWGGLREMVSDLTSYAYRDFP